MKMKDVLNRVITGAPEYASDVRCSSLMRQDSCDIRVVLMSSQVISNDTLFVPKTTINWWVINSNYLSNIYGIDKDSLYSMDLHAFSFNAELTEVCLYKKDGDLRTPDARLLDTNSFFNCFSSSTPFYVVVNGKDSSQPCNHLVDKLSAVCIVSDLFESHCSNPSRYTFGLNWFVVAGKFVVLNITSVDKKAGKKGGGHSGS